MSKMHENVAVACALEKDSISGDSKTTGKFELQSYRRACFYMFFEAADDNFKINNDTVQDVTVTLKKQKGTAGDTGDVREAVDINAGEAVQKMKVENADDWTAEDTLTINGVTFEKVASGADTDEKEFHDGDTLAEAIGKHLEGISATDSSDDVTVEVDDNTTSMTVSADIDTSATDQRVSILEASAVMECHISELGDEYSHVYLNLDDSDAGTVNATVMVLLGNAYFQPVKQPGKIL